jgi:hypothetical protein
MNETSYRANSYQQGMQDQGESWEMGKHVKQREAPCSGKKYRQWENAGNLGKKEDPESLDQDHVVGMGRKFFVFQHVVEMVVSSL